MAKKMPESEAYGPSKVKIVETLRNVSSNYFGTSTMLAMKLSTKSIDQTKYFSSRSYTRLLAQECIKTSTMISPMAIG